MKYSLNDFAAMIVNANNMEQAREVAAKIIIETSSDSDLISESFHFINNNFDKAMNDYYSNMSELN